MTDRRLPLSTVKHSAFERLARFWRDRFTLLIVCIAVLGTVHLLVRTATYGLATSYQSLAFLETARSFLAGEGLRNLWGVPLTGWPPLLPLLLAALGWVGIDPLAGIRWVHAAAFGLTILAAGSWLRSHLRAQWLAVAASAAIAADLPLNLFASKIGTDFLFAVLTLLALMQLATFLHRGGRRPLLWGAVFTALAAITRYLGVVLIGAGVLMLLVRRTPSRAVRLKDSIVFGTVSSLPLVVVLTRNWALSGSWTGREEQSGQSLSAGLSQTVDMFRKWVINQSAPDELGALVWLAVGLLVAVGVVVVVSGRGLGLGRHTGEARPAALFGLGPVLPFGVFALAYSAFLVVVVPFTVGQGIDHRYLLPVYVPLLLVAVVLLDGFLSIQVAGRLVAVRFVLASLVLLAFLARTGFSAYRNLRITDKVYVTGFRGALNSSYWEPSATVNYIMSHPREGKIYTNYAGPSLPWFGDRLPALGKYRLLPRVGIHKLTSHIMRQTDGEGAHIVWSYNTKRSLYDYNYLDIRFLLGVDTVAELSDGVVFRVTAAEPFDAARHRARKERYIDHLIQQASERVVRAGWEVYRTGRKLIYRKESCAPADVQAMFVLHVIPVDPADLPADRQQYSSDNRDFRFDWEGFRLGGRCMVITHLPTYPIDRLHIGQSIAKDNRTLWEALWEADMEMHRARKERYIDHFIQQASERVVRAGWEVYRTGRMLIYRKEPCAPADVQAKFVLHVIPVDPADLPADRQQYSSDNRDFYFNWDSYFDWDAFDWDARRQSSSFRLGGQCIAVAHLPAYPIDRIYIGQWISAEDRTLWDAEFSAGR